MKGGIKMEFTENDLTTIKAALLAYDLQLIKKIADDNFDTTIKEMDKVEVLYNKIITNKFDNIFL